MTTADQSADRTRRPERNRIFVFFLFFFLNFLNEATEECRAFCFQNKNSEKMLGFEAVGFDRVLRESFVWRAQEAACRFYAATFRSNDQNGLMNFEPFRPHKIAAAAQSADCAGQLIHLFVQQNVGLQRNEEMK